MTDQIEVFKCTFFEECGDLLAAAESQLSVLAQDARDAEAMAAIFRAVHSIKGGAGAFGFERLVNFAHVFESVLDVLRGDPTQAEARLDRSGHALLMRSFDMLSDLVAVARGDRVLPRGRESALAAALGAWLGDAAPSGAPAADAQPPVAATGPRRFRVCFIPAPDLLRKANEPLLLFRELRSFARVTALPDVGRLHALEEMESDTAYLARTLEVETAADAARIDEVFEFVADDSDLTIEALAEPPSAAHPAARRSEPTAADTAPGAAPALTGSIRVNLEKVDRLLNMVGEIVITQAMLSQQINSLQLGRHPELVQELEQMAHHVRELQENVMSIRAQPVRSVFARMPRPVRELADELGKEARVVTVGEGTEVDKTVIEQLSDPLTHLVRNAVDHGRGSRFSVSLPLTLAVLDGMIVTVASERYIVPLTNIIESLRPRASDISRLGPGRDVLAIRGAYVPLVYLARALHTGRAITDPTQGLVVLVEAEGDEKLVIVVDEMLGQQQMVIKSLVSNYRQIAGISAATILGDGRVALILDVGGLRQLEATPALEPMPEQALVA